MHWFALISFNSKILAGECDVGTHFISKILNKDRFYKKKLCKVHQHDEQGD